MIVDLHNHAELSMRTELTLDDYVRGARCCGLALAITEHNHLYHRAGSYGGVLVLAGMEILNDYGDYLVFGVPEECVQHREIFDLIDHVHDCGGVIVAAHPFSRYGVCWTLDKELAGRVVDRVDAVEVLNGQATHRAWQLAADLAAAHGKPGTGGSDAHRPQHLFRTATCFLEPVESVDDVVQAIRAGACEPILLDGRWR